MMLRTPLRCAFTPPLLVFVRLLVPQRRALEAIFSNYCAGSLLPFAALAWFCKVIRHDVNADLSLSGVEPCVLYSQSHLVLPKRGS